jgi:hypothetical protein
MPIRPLLVDVSDLWQDTNKSSLKASIAAGVNSFTVYSITDFAINKILLIGEYGEEGSEIIKTHGSTAPTSFTVTLASNTTKPHPKDTPVYLIPYDSIEISHATTETGTKTVMSTQTINPENPEIRYDDSTYTSGYYFTRYKETITNTFSNYSDAIPFEGYAINTVGYLIYGALAELGKNLSDILTYDILIRRINACLSFTRGKLKTWSNYQEFDYIIDQMNRGEYRFELPTTYYDKNSNKSCLSIRVGSGDTLIYKDKREFNEMMKDVIHTTVATTALTSATALILTSTADLDDTGTIHIYKNNTLYEIDYSANDKTTNTLTVTALTADMTAELDVWINEREETPNYFSIWDGYLYIWGLNNETDTGKNIYMDFYTDIVQIDSDTDILTGTRYDLVDYWLKWEIKNITDNNGKKDFKDGDWVMFLTILNDAIRREDSGQKFKRNPKISGINYNMEDNLDFDRS